jgi:coatomer subunit beta'
VKKLSQTFEVDEKKFNQEFESLMRVKHKNIVRFLGYCADTQGKVCKFEGKNVMAEERQRLLCFEFMPKGSLDKYIKGTSSHLICSIYSKINQLLKLATLNLINL